MVSHYDFSDDRAEQQDAAISINDHPVVLLPDASFLLTGSFEKSGFDLVITNPSGETHIVYDYFAFDPPPNLMIAGGAGFSPEMVMHKLHLAYGEDVMFAGPAASATNQIEVGKVTLLLGNVTVKRADANGEVIEVQLSRGDTLYKGDEITTSGRGFIKAKMLDGTKFHLGKNANAVLTEFVFNEEAKVGNFEAFVTRGGFHYKSGKIGKMLADGSKNHSTISTPTAVIGIRGSELDGDVDPTTGSTVVVHRSGILSITDINGQNEVVLDTSGNTSNITLTGTPSKTALPSPQQLEALEQNLPPPDTAQELQEEATEEEAPPEEDLTAEGEERPSADGDRQAKGEGAADGEKAPGEGDDDPSTEKDGERAEQSDEDAPGEGDGEDGEPSAEGDKEPSAEGDKEPSAEGDKGSAEGNKDSAEAARLAAAAAKAAESAGDNAAKPSGDGAGQAPREAESEAGTNPETEQSGTGTSGVQGPVEQQQNQPTSQETQAPSGVTIRENAFPDADPGVVGDQTGELLGVGSGTNDSGTTSGAGTDADSSPDSTNPAAGDQAKTDEPRINEPVTEELQPDNPPTARDDFLSVNEADEIDISALLLSNDSDGDPGQNPRILQVTPNGAQGGQLSFDGTQVRYLPSAEILNNLRGGETATETFTYRVKSGDLTDSATLTVRLVGTNEAPTASDDQGETVEGSRLMLDVLSNDADADGDDLRIESVDTSSSQGTVTISPDGSGLIYNPSDNLRSGAVAQDVFTYKVSDGQLTDTATVTITVTGKNDPPVINTEGEPFKVSAGNGPTNIPLNVIFADADLGDELEVVSIDTSGTTGTVTIGSIIYDDGGRFRFLGEGERGTDSFGVTVIDEDGATGSGRYTLEVVGVNDAPEAIGDAYTVLAEQVFNTPAALGLLANDTDIDEDDLQVNTTAVSGPSNGSVVLGASGAFSYTPNAGFIGVDSFVYEAVDPFGGVSTATVVLRVTEDISSPVAVADAFTVSVDGTLNGNVLANDFDPNAESLFSALGNSTQNGTLSLSQSGLFEYTPNAGFSGEDTFSYVLTNASGQTATATVSLTVSGVNLAPDALPINPQELPVGQSSVVDLSNFFSDPEGADLFFDFVSSASFLTLNGSVLSATPTAADLGLSFSVEVGASDGENVTTTVFTIDVVDPNLPPELLLAFNDQTILVGGSVNANVSSRFSDPDGDPLTFALTTNASFLVLDRGNLLGLPSAADVGVFSVTIEASDGKETTSSSFTLTVNDPPVNAPTVVVSGNDSTVTNFSVVNLVTDTLVVTDTDGLAPSPFTITAQGINGSATINAITGAWDYVPTVNTFTGTDSFTVTVVDGLGASTEVPINLLIRPADTPATFPSGLTGSGVEDTPITNTLVALEADPVGATPFAISSQPANGVAVINASTGLWTYTPNAEFAGTDSFIVTFTDGFNYTESPTISVNVSPVNDQTPVADDESFTVLEGGVATESDLDVGISLLDGDVDADLPGDTLQAFVLSQPNHSAGPITLNSDGTFTYTHDGSENHTDSFTYHVFDGANTDTGTVTITVTPVNDNAPVADNESLTVAQGGTGTESDLDVGLSLLDGDTDADLPADTLAVVPAAFATTNGNVNIAANGTFSYTHDGSGNLTDSFTYQVTDGVNTSTATVSVTVSALINNVPTGSPVILGTSEVGQVLTADTSGIADADGLGAFSYQWFAGAEVAFGPTSTATYTTSGTDVNKALSVVVTYTDGAGNVEQVVSDTVLVGAQSGLVSGTQSYTLIPGIQDLVFGTDGNENITLIGDAEAGDLVDLGDGFDTLTLDGLGNSIAVEGVEVITGGAGADFIVILGDLDSLSGILSNRDASDGVAIDGTVVLDTEVIGSTAGNFIVSVDGNLELGGSTGSQIVFDFFSTNDGRVVLDSTGTSRVTVSSGSLMNNGEFISTGPSGVPNEFEGFFVNDAGASLTVQKDLAFINGSLLDLRVNTNMVNIESGQILIFDNSTLQVNGNSALTGRGDISLENGSILLVDTNYVHDASSPALFTDGTATFNGGNFSLGMGATLILAGDTVNTSTFDVAGSLRLDGGGTTSFNSSFNVQPSGQVSFESSSALGLAQPTVTGNFDNFGAISLDNVDGSSAAIVNLVVTSGNLTNNSTGVIQSIDDDESLTGTNRHTIDANLNNAGRVEVIADLELNRISGMHTNSGQIELLNSGKLYVVNGTSFTNTAGGRIFGNGSIVTDTPLVSQGIIEPETGEPVGATINIFGDLDLEPAGTIDIDVLNAFGDHDVVDVTGVLDVEGSLHINFVTIAGLESGGTIDNVLVYGSLGGNTDFLPMNINHNLGAGYDVTVVDDGAAFDIVVTTSFDNSFNDGGSGSDWNEAANWLSGVLPTVADDVVIDGYVVDHDNPVISPAKSLSLFNSTLSIRDGSIELSEDSRIGANSILNVTTGSGTSGTLSLAQSLVVEGAFNFDDGSITSTTTTSLINTVGPAAVLNITATASTFLDVDVVNDGGTVNLFGSGTFLASSVEFDNNGQFNIQDTLIVDTKINNNNGDLTLGDAGKQVDVTLQQNLDNSQNGTINIDTPGTFNTSVILDVSDVNSFGTINFLDNGGTGSTFRLVDLGQNGNVFLNGGTINVFANTDIDIEAATLNSDAGGIIVSPGASLRLNGGATGGTLELGSGSFLSGSGDLIFLNDVAINLTSDLFLDTGSLSIDTTAANVTFNNANLTLGVSSSLTLNAGDTVNSNLNNSGVLSLTTDVGADNVNITGLFSNFGLLEINSASGSGVKLFDFGFVNNGSIVMNMSAIDNNVFEVGSAGTATLTNNNLFQSDNPSVASVANIFRGTLINNGTLEVRHDLDLNEDAVAVMHENNGTILINTGQTLTLGINNDLTNHSGAVIVGNGILDVSANDVDFLNEGVIVPGGQSATDIFNIVGNATTVFGTESEVEVDLNGIVPGTSHDQLVLTGAAAPQLGGRLNVNLISGYSPVNLDLFVVLTSVAALSSSFTQIEGTDLLSTEGIVFVVDQTANDISLTARTPTITGGAADDALAGTIAVDVIHGGDGNDSITGLSTGDTTFGGNGNDFFETDATYSRIVGGEGIDSLRVTDAVQDFTSGANSGFVIEDIEALDYNDGSMQTLTLDNASIRVMVDGGNELLGLENAIVFFGDANDLVLLNGDFFVFGEDVLDIRTPGVFEAFTVLQDSVSDTYFAFGQQARVEVSHASGTKIIFGSSGNDVINGGIEPDVLHGRDGDDILEGGAGSDAIFGDAGNDEIIFDIGDLAPVGGGTGIDKLTDSSPGATIDLSGVTNFTDFESFDMRDADGSDSLTLGLGDIVNIVGLDNGLEAILPDGQIKFVIEGDSGDALDLDGNLIHTALSTGSLSGGWTAPFGAAESDYLGNGTNYLKLTNGGVDIYIHEDVSNVV